MPLIDMPAVDLTIKYGKSKIGLIDKTWLMSNT